MRHFLASLVLVSSILAHGFWRAGNVFHHFFGGILVMLVAVIILPVALFRRARRKYIKWFQNRNE